MKFYLFSNCEDTLTGMRLAGIEGEYVNEKDKLISSLLNKIKSRDIGVILINASLAAIAEKEIIEIKRSAKTLVVEIPDTDSAGENDSISRYIRDAIGLKI